jgi:hypothetical protein
MKKIAATLVSVVALTGSALAGPDWTEVGDAGSSLPTAQIPAGVGQIHSIAGSLGGEIGEPDFEDMYIIGIDEPTTFRLDLLNANFDAQLFIFNITLSGGAIGLLANDNADEILNTPVLTNMATDGTNAVIDLAGTYLVGVSGAGRNPISAGGLIFDIQNPSEVSGADGPGGLLRHIGWEGEGAVGDYAIDMTSTIFPQIPAPAGIAALGLAGVCASRRRRA